MAKRANGEGTIYFEKGRNKWRCFVTDQQGKPISERFDSQKAANVWRLEMLAKINKGTYIVSNDITLGEWVIKFLQIFAKPKVREKTFNGYLDTASHITEDFAATRLQKITPLQVQAFINGLDASEYTREKVGKLLKRVSKKAYLLGIIEKDFTIGVEVPHPEDKDIEVFSVTELHKIFDMLETTENLRRHYLLIALAVASGCRMGELLALTPNDISDDSIIIRRALVESKGKLLLKPPKTKAGRRIITLPSTIIETLKFEASKREPDDYIFKNTKGNSCRTSNIGKSWKLILQRAEVRYRKFHCLRHTHATMLLAAGVPVNEVSKRLGHSKPSTTLNLYGHAIPGYDKSLPSVVSQIFKLDEPKNCTCNFSC